jgi:serine phosphatase RsbU (regulator of sigma subunit)/anti-sigma regulatory factor (Ser/Thr protein kinase)
MTARLQTFRQVFGRRRTAEQPAAVVVPGETLVQAVAAPAVDIAPNDPLIAYFQSASGAVDIDRMELDSPALAQLRENGVRLIVPLMSQGELIGLLNLGPRLSEQEYSADDRRLLNNLAAQAAPAVRVAQLVQEQQAEARERERIDQELRVAQLIQQQFLPKQLPQLPGWQLAAHYQPAREVGGDFYDMIELPDGQVGIVVGDVTDKGVPAALVMASTRSILRADAPRLVSPAAVLERANELLCPSIPAQMFVTCLYAVLDPASGRLRFANAGHNLPYLRTPEGVVELRATGMPLGLLPGMVYDEQETTLAPGQSMLLYSDGIVEGHDPGGEMFGFPRVAAVVAQHEDSDELIDRLLTGFGHFTGAEREQEDDITLVALRWTGEPGRIAMTTDPLQQCQLPASNGAAGPETGAAARVLADFIVASEPGNERIVMDRVAEAIAPLDLSPPTVERLKTAVSEAAMNAIEHGNQYRADVPVQVRVLIRKVGLSVEITDQGGDPHIPILEAPDIDLKLAGLQTPRGWGLFLIQNMVDEMRRSVDGSRHTVELVVYLKGHADADAAV